MAVPKQLKGKGKKFSSTNQPSNPGRKKSKLKAFVKESDIGAKDIAIIIKQLFDKTEDELKDMLTDKKQPFLMRMFIRSLFEDLKKGDISNLNKLMDRSLGKVTDKIEHTGDLSVNINIVPAGGKK